MTGLFRFFRRGLALALAFFCLAMPLGAWGGGVFGLSISLQWEDAWGQVWLTDPAQPIPYAGYENSFWLQVSPEVFSSAPVLQIEDGSGLYASFLPAVGEAIHRLYDKIMVPEGLGDVGLKYGPHIFKQLRSAMSMSPATFLVMRGNHDARYIRDIEEGAYLGAAHMREKQWCGIRALYDERDPNILYLPDEGGAFVRNGHACLVLPGAFSVDDVE